MNDIIGIYAGLSDDDWYPSSINVNISKLKINGIYNKLDKGGGGVIYLNELQNTILKVKYFGYDDDPEVKYQKQAKNYAPKIFYECFRKIGCDLSHRKAFHGDSVQIIIMEYLNPDKWIPLRSIQQLSVSFIHNKLFELIYNFIFDFKIKNATDFVGNTGPHIFMNEETEEIKVIDYGTYEGSTNHIQDFFIMVSNIQDTIIRHPSDKLLECYDKIKNLNEKITDNKCKKLLLYKARLFLEKKHHTKNHRHSKNKHGSKKSIKNPRK